MECCKLHHSNCGDQIVKGNKFDGWIFDKMIQRKQRLRDLFLARHLEADTQDSAATSVNWFDALG